MAGEKKVSIKIETKSDTKGAKDASAEVNKLVAAEKQLDSTSDQATNSIAGMRAEIDRLSAQLERAEVNSEEFVATARQIDLAQSRLDTTLKTTGTGFKNVGMLIGQAGFQVQDFAVQVGGGTSALTAFAQQGSQLLGMFGPGGAVAGALLAIGAIAARVFQDANDKSEIFMADMEQTAQNAADNISDDFDKIIEAIDRSSRQAEILAGRYDGIREASDKYSQSELENANKRRDALQIINELLGRQRDLLKELKEQQQADADKRSLTTQQEIAAQRDRVSKAEETLTLKTQELAKNEDALANLRSDLVLQNQKLETLRAQKRELEEAAKFDRNLIQPDAPPEVSAIINRGLDAQRQLNDPEKNKARDGDIAVAERESDRLASLIEGRQKKIEQSELAIEAAVTAFENVTGNVAIEIGRITEASKSQELLSTATNAKETIAAGSSQLVDLLKGILAEAAPANEAQKKVFDLVTSNLKDGKVTAEETKKVADLIKADSISLQDSARGALLASETQKAARQMIESAISDLSINANEASQIAGALPNLMKALSGLNQKSLEQIGVILNLLSIHTQNLNGIDSRLRLIEGDMENFRGN